MDAHRLGPGQAAPAPSGPVVSPTRRRLDALVASARRALLWEASWPRIWLPLAVLLVFLAASWLGLWLDLPVWARQAGLAGFGLAFVAAFWPWLRHRNPSRHAALDRVDRDSGLGHRPARSFEDTLELGHDDPGARALWALHLRRQDAAIRRLKVTRPRPGMTRRDPFAARAALILATVGAAFVAGPEAWTRLASAFDWQGARLAAPPFRVDGWIDPPHYTRLPPLMIDLASGEQQLKAPVGSTVVIRMAGRGEATLTPKSGLVAMPAPEQDGQRTAAAPARPGDTPDAGGQLREQRYRLAGNADLDVGIGTVVPRHLRLRVEAVPDRPPEISLSGAPELNARGTFSLTYKARDDYGLVSAEARFDRPQAPGRRSLVPPPRVPLLLPSDARSGEETKTTADLSDHPWAGARVMLTLAARDEADQEGTSVPVEFTLPQRTFTRPLAKALVEQRRNIILDPDLRRPVQLALDSLLIAPERFTPEWGVYLGLRAASERLRRARTDADLTEVADWLWAMALQIEEGDLTEAEREVRAAQDRLREAIDRNADEKEIARLTDELRRAMDKFLQEFVERMQQEQRETGERPTTGNERVITQDDLNRMLNEMQDAMRRGDTAEAQRLLDQLRSLMENLRTARPGNRMSDPMAREMSRQMQELDSLTREQQQLRDETYRQGQQGRRGRDGQRQQGQRGQRGQQGQQGQQGQGEAGEQEEAENGDGQGGQQGQGQRGQGQQGQRGGLGQRQQALRERLQDLQRRMRGNGMQGEQGFEDAEGAMRDAEGELGQGQDGSAVDSQGRALEGLQRGMQSMAQQMQQMMGQGDGQDQGGEPSGPGNPQGRAQNDPRSDDPLGRPTRSRDFSDGRVRIPGANESAVERARRILEELQRKLGDPSRPREELDYFERLLRRN